MRQATYETKERHPSACGKTPVRPTRTAVNEQRAPRQLGNGYAYKLAEKPGARDGPDAGHDYTKKGPAPGSTTGTAGGLSGLTLDVTFTVAGEPATSLQVIQVFWGTRRTDSKQVGTLTWTENSKTYDAFVDGGKNSPYVVWGGNPPAHPTLPYYLTADEVKSQVNFTKDSGTVKIYDAPGAVAAHDEANFETAVVAINHKASGRDRILKAFDWGWTGKGTTPTVGKGSDIAGKDSGISIKNSVSSRFDNIVKNDYSTYVHD
jgi:hypothetical protein